MKASSLLILVLVLLQIRFVASAQTVIYEDSFENNDLEWRLLNTPADRSAIKGGKLQWQHQDPSGSCISNYFNLIDTKAEYSAEAKFIMPKLGSEYGLMSGTDQENAVYCLIKGMQYRVLLVRNGKATALKESTTSLKLKPTGNTLKITIKGNTLSFYSNNILLTDVPYPAQDLGKALGFALWGNSAVDIDDFSVTGKKLNINLAPNLHYATPPENLGKNVNSVYGELTPVVTPDGKGLYFTRTYSPENKGGSSDYQDVYFSAYENGAWTKAVNIGTPVNNDGPNAVYAVSPDGNTMLLMNTYDSKGAAMGMGLSMTRRTKDGWGMPHNLNIRNFYNRSTFNEFYLSNDKKVLLLALHRDDTYGSRDIYVSFREPDSDIWSTPKNIGPVVNSAGTELSPFLAADGVTLYFSSTGHPGYGKNDIFVSRRLDNTWTNWTEPQNLGTPVNSKGMDAYYSVPASGEYAYYVSEENSIGKSDIMRIKLPTTVKPNPTVLIYGKVLNSKTGEPIETGITYRDLESDNEMGIAHSSPRDGSYKMTLPYDNVYAFFAEKIGFYSVRDSISIPHITEYMEIERNIYLTPLEIGEDIPLRNVFFVRSKAVLLPPSLPELKKLAKMLEENPSIEIQISGHTDNVGNPDDNQKLSEDRAESVKEYLVSKGISPDRITCKGYGGSKPVADNSREETRKLNRRVEFKIVKI